MAYDPAQTYEVKSYDVEYRHEEDAPWLARVFEPQGNGPFPALSREIRGSAVMRGLDRAFPRPPSLLGEVRGLLNRFGFPQVFADLPPAPAGVWAAPKMTALRPLRCVGVIFFRPLPPTAAPIVA